MDTTFEVGKRVSRHPRRVLLSCKIGANNWCRFKVDYKLENREKCLIKSVKLQHKIV